MKNTKHVELLEELSQRRVKKLNCSLNSPGKNRNRDFQALLDAIKKCYPAFDSPKFTDENVYKVIVPGQKFDKARFAVEAFYMFESACQFLKGLECDKNDIEQDLSLMRQLIERGMDGAFEKLSKKLDKLLIPANFQLDAFFRYRFTYEDLLMTYNIRKHDFELQLKHSLKKADCSIRLSSLGLYGLLRISTLPKLIITYNPIPF